MTTRSWIRSLFTRPATRRAPEGSRKAPPRGRLGVEALEDRTVPSTFTVLNTNDSGPGSLRDAIAQAHAVPNLGVADLIDFGDGSASGGTNFLDSTPDTITLTTELFLFDAATTTISGPGQSLLRISGNDAHRVFNLNSGSSALSGLTISDGANVGGGAGLFNGGTAWLTDCTITDNSAVAVGGGMQNAGTLTMTNCTVSNNSTGSPGGGGLITGGTATLINCTFSDNSAVNGSGDGVWNLNPGTLTVTGCTFSRNSAGGGGGLYTLGGTVTLSNSTFSDNSADLSGGGLANAGGTATVTNCTFNDNSAGFQGGGIVNDSNGTLNVTNCTVTGNSAPDGGGIDQRFGTMTLGNTIASGNTGPSNKDIRGVITTDLGHNLLGAALSVTTSGPGNIYTDTPMLGALANNGGPTQTMALLPGSPAINAGDNALAVGITTDQRGSGFARIVNGTVDIGAFEVQNQAPTVTVPGARTAYEDVDLAFSGANAITVGDPNGDNLTVTLSVSHGTLTLGTFTGLSVTGNGSGLVTLSGSSANLNTALASLLYRGSLNYSGGDTLNVTVGDGSLSSNGNVGITVKSAAQQAADLQAQVTALKDAGVLNNGRANTLISSLNLKGNNGDVGRVQDFLAHVSDFLNAGILTQAQADALLGLGNALLLSVTRQ